MQRRQFIVSTLTAPALALSSAGLSLGSSVAPEPQPEGVEPSQNPLAPETYFWIEREYYDGELHQTRIVGDDNKLAARRKQNSFKPKNSRWRKRYAKVRFVPLSRAKRFILVRSDWSFDTRPYHGGDGPLSQTTIDAYQEATANFPDPVSLLDIPNEEGTNELNVRSGDWLTRDQAIAKAAEYNAKAAAERLKEHGEVFNCDWWMVVEFGRPVEKPLLYISIEDGIGDCHSGVEYPTRLVQTTEAEKARYPFSSVLDQLDSEDVAAVKGGAA